MFSGFRSDSMALSHLWLGLPGDRYQSERYDTIRYDTRCYFNVRSKADMSQLNLPHGTDN